MAEEIKMSSIGQLIITGIEGTALKSEEKKFLEEEDIGGVILFARNYENKIQLAQLINDIQSVRKEYPLFIGVDQEGGRVMRFKKDFKPIPPMFQLGEKGSPKACFELHLSMGKELQSCGVNLNFSPVCDIWTNPENEVIGDRSFGTSAEVVEQFISGAIRGLQSSGILACAKHFPGHGDTKEDSHFFLPKNTMTLNQMREREFLPFLKAAKSRVEFMMVAHIIVPEWDEGKPCSLVKKTYECLREEIKFKKIIITDDLEMQAITNHWEIPEASFMALEAGTDILLFRHLPTAQKTLEYLKELYRKRKLTTPMLAEKNKRILECKKKHFAHYAPINLKSLTQMIVGTK
jgi:beta-N-acetylhexosaminidase